MIHWGYQTEKNFVLHCMVNFVMVRLYSITKYQGKRYSIFFILLHNFYEKIIKIKLYIFKELLFFYLLTFLIKCYHQLYIVKKMWPNPEWFSGATMLKNNHLFYGPKLPCQITWWSNYSLIGMVTQDFSTHDACARGHTNKHTNTNNKFFKKLVLRIQK